jgi:Copper binding periplasmic protein CusF.
MKTKLLSLLALFLLPLAAFAAAGNSNDKNCGCSCCVGKAVCCCFVEESAEADKSAATSDSEKSDTALARHPLRGVIVAVRPDDSALLVKHEAIPGYMRAMTMLFKVDAAALSALKKGDAIAATLVQREDAFYLENITKR